MLCSFKWFTFIFFAICVAVMTVFVYFLCALSPLLTLCCLLSLPYSQFGLTQGAFMQLH